MGLMSISKIRWALFCDDDDGCDEYEYGDDDDDSSDDDGWVVVVMMMKIIIMIVIFKFSVSAWRNSSYERMSFGTCRYCGAITK